MATSDAIADLGDTLVAVLQTGLQDLGLIEAGHVLLSTPDEFAEFAPTKPTVTVFLYHVSVHGEMRNAAPKTLVNGSVQRPPLPLELRLLITPWTKVVRDAYRITGAITQLLYDHTVLHFGELLGTSWAPDDTVEVILESLPVEEHYDIWETTDIPYKLSLSYLARVVGIDSTIAKAAAPVVDLSLPKVGP